MHNLQGGHGRNNITGPLPQRTSYAMTPRAHTSAAGVARGGSLPDWSPCTTCISTAAVCFQQPLSHIMFSICSVERTGATSIVGTNGPSIAYFGSHIAGQHQDTPTPDMYSLARRRCTRCWQQHVLVVECRKSRRSPKQCCTQTSHGITLASDHAFSAGSNKCSSLNAGQVADLPNTCCTQTAHEHHIGQQSCIQGLYSKQKVLGKL